MIATLAVGAGAAIAGGNTGSIVGTAICPGAGTVVGTIVGSIIGGITGSFFGGMIKRSPLSFVCTFIYNGTRA